MAAGRPIFGLLAMILTAGACLLMFLTILGGVRNHKPLNQIYFLQADTSNIPGAPSISRWTMWNLCSIDGHGNNLCGKAHPDFPLDPPAASNFNTTINIPHQFIGNNHYYYMTRFIFPFVLIALFFSVISLFTGVLALCTRIGSFLSAVFAWIGWIFQIVASALMTAAYVMGRNDFNNNGQSAILGKMAFGFMWGAVGCLTLATVLYCMGGRSSHSSDGYVGRRGFFGPRRHASTRSGGSFNARKEYA
jgi:hypothetical protein